MLWLVLTVISLIYDLVHFITTINNNWGVNPAKIGNNFGLIGCHLAIASWLILIGWSFRFGMMMNITICISLKINTYNSQFHSYFKNLGQILNSNRPPIRVA